VLDTVDSGEHSHQGRNADGYDQGGENGSEKIGLYGSQALFYIFDQIHG
jgi:hypothetical protein